MNKPIIEIKNLNLLQEGYEIFKDLNLNIFKGEFIYLIGETGSGKSSLLKALYADLKFKTGEIIISNINLKNIKANKYYTIRRKLGIIFQDFKLLNDRTIFKNLEFVLKATGWKEKNEISKKINSVLEQVSLLNYQDKMPHELSGGEQQRASIARALLNDPEIILADEPTGNLDPEKSEKIIKLLKQINEKGTTIIIASHDYSIIKKFSAKILKCENQNIFEVQSNSI
tara:strand:- start:6600 stop:7283 length:684 start_codon:yes stop_codon:yes gene_type:complete